MSYVYIMFNTNEALILLLKSQDTSKTNTDKIIKNTNHQATSMVLGWGVLGRELKFFSWNWTLYMQKMCSAIELWHLPILPPGKSRIICCFLAVLVLLQVLASMPSRSHFRNKSKHNITLSLSPISQNVKKFFHFAVDFSYISLLHFIES